MRLSARARSTHDLRRVTMTALVCFTNSIWRVFAMKKLGLATLAVALMAAQVVLAADQGKSAAKAAPAKPATEAKAAPATTPAPTTAPADKASEPMAKKGKKHHHHKKSEKPAEQPK